MHKDILPDLKNKIHTIRGKQVMLDRNLAEMYGVETRYLNKAVKRNIKRFPVEFMFQLNQKELVDWKFQIGTSNHSYDTKSKSIKIGLRKLPYAFTEQGVSMLSAVLRSPKAVEVSVQIIKAFVAMRHFLLENKGIFQKFQQIDQKLIAHDENFTKLFTALESKQLTPNQGIFYDGQIYDAHTFIVELISKAKKEIILIDPYIDTSVLTLMSHKAKDVKVIIYTKELSEKLKLGEKKFNKQYGN